MVIIWPGLYGPDYIIIYDYMAIKKYHPGAVNSWDVSPWLLDAPMRTWRDFSTIRRLILFTRVEVVQIIQCQQTWRFMHELTGLPIIADTGYGVAGAWESKRNYALQFFFLSQTLYSPFLLR